MNTFLICFLTNIVHFCICDQRKVMTTSYFAYGSNMKYSILEKRAASIIQCEGAGLLNNHRLVFNVRGIPFLEPAFASVIPSLGDDVHGVLYKLSIPSYLRLLRSEGVPIVYFLQSVDVKLYKQSNMTINAWTLRSVAGPFQIAPNVNLLPSKAYLKLMIEGAKDAGIDDVYNKYLEELYRKATIRGVPRNS